MSVQSSFERAQRFERDIRTSIASEAVPYTWGTAFFTPEFDKVWDLNFLSVERDDPPFTADDLIAEADRLQGGAGLGHRRLNVDRREWAVALIPSFSGEEWMVNRFVYMALERRDHMTVEPVRAQEIDRDQHHETYMRTTAEAPHGSDPEVVRQLTGQTDLIAEHHDVRYFGAVDDDGTLASICVMFSDGATAQIEDVATLRAYRKRGLGKELVALAIEEAERAGHDFVFLVADEEDWPKEMYGRLGFDPIGTGFDFVRPGDVVYRNEDP